MNVGEMIDTPHIVAQGFDDVIETEFPLEHLFRIPELVKLISAAFTNYFSVSICRK